MATLTDILNPQKRLVEASFKGRSSQATVALMMFIERPLTGQGYSLYEENYLRFSDRLGLDGRGEARQAHSLYLEVMAETGIVGTFSFGAMLFIFYYVSQKAVRDLRSIGRDDLVPWIRGIQLGFLSFMFTSIFLHDDWVRYFRFALALMASCSVMADTVIRRHNERLMKEQSETGALI